MRSFWLVAAFALCGCNTTHFSRTETWIDPVRGPVTNIVSVSNSRCVWTTESYVATLTATNASLAATRSSTDQETIQILCNAIISMASKGMIP